MKNHDYYFAQLPWWVNHSLEQDELEELDQHIHSCEECQKEVTLLKKMQQSLASENIPDPDTNRAFSKVMQRIDAEPVKSSWHTRISDMVSIALQPRYAVPAFAVILACVVGLRFMVDVEIAPDFQLLSSPDDTELFIVTVTGVSSLASGGVRESIETALKGSGWMADIVELDDNVFQLRSAQSPPVAMLSDLVNTLKQSEEVIDVKLQ